MLSCRMWQLCLCAPGVELSLLPSAKRCCRFCTPAGFCRHARTHWSHPPLRAALVVSALAAVGTGPPACTNLKMCCERTVRSSLGIASGGYGSACLARALPTHRSGATRAHWARARARPACALLGRRFAAAPGKSDSRHTVHDFRTAPAPDFCLCSARVAPHRADTPKSHIAPCQPSNG